MNYFYLFQKEICFDDEDQKIFLWKWENQLYDSYSNKVEDKKREQVEYKLQENLEK